MMDFEIAASSKGVKVSAYLGLHVGVSCEVVLCMNDFLDFF